MPETSSSRNLFISAFLVGFSGAIVPGPMLAAVIASVPRYGAWAGPWVVLGHGLAEGVVIALLAAGLGRWLSRDQVLTAIGLVGGVALIWFGWITLEAARTVTLSKAGDGGGLSISMHPFVAGIVTSVLNPYWLFWWATIGVTYVALGAQRGVRGLCTFGVGHLLSDAVWFTFVSTALALGRGLIGDDVFRFIVGACGVGLMLFGLRFAYGGLRRGKARS